MTRERADGPRASAADLPLSRLVSAFAVLMAAEFLYGWAWSSVDVLRPLLRAEFALSLVQVGAFYTAQAAGALVGAVVIGQVADRLGRRDTLAGILVLSGVVFGFAAVAQNYPALLAQRVCLGLVLGGAQPVIASIYIGLFPTRVRGRLASIVNAGFTASALGLGVGVAMLSSPQDWRILVWLGAGAPIALAALIGLVPMIDATRAMTTMRCRARHRRRPRCRCAICSRPNCGASRSCSR